MTSQKARERQNWRLKAAYRICAKLPNPENELGIVQAVESIIRECEAQEVLTVRCARCKESVDKVVAPDGGGLCICQRCDGYLAGMEEAAPAKEAFLRLVDLGAISLSPSSAEQDELHEVASAIREHCK